MPGNPDIEKRAAVVEALRRGLSFDDIVDQTGASHRLIYVVLDDTGGVLPKPKSRSARRLSLQERISIEVGIARGQSLRCIAECLDRAPSSICREVNANGGLGKYQALRADNAARKRSCRPKKAKLVECKRLHSVVQQWLTKKYSPRQISERLVSEFPDDDEMRISHEAIYQALFIQSRGALRKELTAALRTGRTARRPQGRTVGAKNKIQNMVMISERPADVEDRAIPGHWEGDEIVGKNNRSAIGTLVERNTRYVMLFKLNDLSVKSFNKALTRTVKRLPKELFKTLTWDQGREMIRHADFSIDTGVEVYFCDPHSPWQRGSNENTNGLLRQYFPKGTDLSSFTQRQLDAVARQLNDRPRETLGFMKPAEKLNQLLR